uniref:U3 small nucleolar RNA-associated protein 15 homolog n=1 Tax=Caenorhabditis tropicalis TaxID=1561998 RepID=A0A1I7ULF3_9PELO
MAQPYLPAEKFLSRKQETILLDEDVIYWKRMQQLTVFQEPSIKGVCSIDFRHDGKLLAIGGDEGKVRVFDVEKTTGSSKVALRVMQASQSTVKSVHFSPRGDTIFSLADDGKIKQYRVADTAYGVNAVPIIDIQAHDDAIRCGAVSSLNDHIVLTGGYDHKVRLWDIRSKEKTMELDCEYPVESVLFLPGEQLIATAAGPIVKIWDTTTGRPLTALQAHYKTVTSLRLATNSTCLLTAGIDRKVNAFRTTNYSLIHSWSMPSPILDIDVSRDDQTMAIGMGNLLALYRRAEIKKETTATAMIEDKRSLVRTSAPPVKLAEKDRDTRKVEVVAKNADKLKIPKVDKMLSNFKHAAVIRLLFNGKFRSSVDAAIVSYLRVIVMRGAIHRALSGQESSVQKYLLIFLNHHLFKTQYFSTLREVTVAFFDVYAFEKLDKDVVKQVQRLKVTLSRELEVQKMISSLIGSIDLIVATTKINVKTSTDLVEDDDVFGEPTIRAKDLDELKPSDVGPKDIEDQEPMQTV